MSIIADWITWGLMADRQQPHPLESQDLTNIINRDLGSIYTVEDVRHALRESGIKVTPRGRALSSHSF